MLLPPLAFLVDLRVDIAYLISHVTILLAVKRLRYTTVGNYKSNEV